MDAEFLREIEGWREQPARSMALRNPRLSVPDLNDAVQRTIGTFPEGTVRLAASVFTTGDDIHATIAAVRKIAHA